MLDNILSSTRKKIDSIIPYSFLNWFQTNYFTWFILRTILIIFLVLPFDHIKSYGKENPKDTYYIIGRRNWSGNGLFSCVIGILSAIEYASDKGYIPIVDMENGNNMYLLNPSEVGKINAWEYFFEQPFEQYGNNCSLDLAYKSKRVIVNNSGNGGAAQALYPAANSSLLRKNTKVLQRLSTQYKKYIRLNEKTKKYIDEQYKKIINNGDNVIGICVRGGEYRCSNPFGHPVQPPIPELISNTRLLMKKWGCNKIFLTTDDYDILQIFIHEFGDLIVSTNRRYTKYEIYTDDTGKHTIQIRQPDRDNEKYLNGLEYLTDIVILSRCNCIIGGTTCGMIGAVLMSDGFEHSYFFDCGVFGLTNKEKCSVFSIEINNWIMK